MFVTSCSNAPQRSNSISPHGCLGTAEKEAGISFCVPLFCPSPHESLHQTNLLLACCCRPRNKQLCCHLLCAPSCCHGGEGRDHVYVWIDAGGCRRRPAATRQQLTSIRRRSGRRYALLTASEVVQGSRHLSCWMALWQSHSQKIQQEIYMHS